MYSIESAIAFSKDLKAYSLTEQKVWDDNLDIEIAYYDADFLEEMGETLKTTANVLYKWMNESDKMNDFIYPYALFESMPSDEQNSILVEFVEYKLNG